MALDLVRLPQIQNYTGFWCPLFLAKLDFHFCGKSYIYQSCSKPCPLTSGKFNSDLNAITANARGIKKQHKSTPFSLQSYTANIVGHQFTAKERGFVVSRYICL